MRFMPSCRTPDARTLNNLSAALVVLMFRPDLGAVYAMQDLPDSSVNVVTMEVFVQADSDRCTRAVEYLTSLADKNRGLRLVVHDVIEDKDQLRRLWNLAQKAGYKKAVVPTTYCCQRLHCGFGETSDTAPKIKDLLTMHVYTRSTWHRCQMAKQYLKQLQPRWPGIHIAIHEITTDSEARSRWNSLSKQYRVVPGLPSIHFANQFIVGYRGDTVTGKQIEALVRKAAGGTENPTPVQSRWKPLERAPDRASIFAWALFPQEPTHEDPVQLPDEADDIPIPEDLMTEPTNGAPVGEDGPEDTIVVPVLGELRVSEIGMPAFTFLVGLVDGFNPCAMWVLVFLLSVLVNVRDRRRMIMIAGTFVVVSGLAYFTFMAAWLNLFILVGIARPVQVTLGCVAVLIGSINVKDFFAFGKGLSLSIPESQKAGIYARVRKIVNAKYLTAALWGAVALAIIVNVIELLCTAGLPALYSQVLTMQNLPAWANYSYLALYNIAYMLDDSIMLTIVVVTLSRSRLQEQHGRWLKLISGTAILLLGAVMIFRPEWLQFAP